MALGPSAGWLRADAPACFINERVVVVHCARDRGDRGGLQDPAGAASEDLVKAMGKVVKFKGFPFL